jgi:hypothetical protein
MVMNHVGLTSWRQTTSHNDVSEAKSAVNFFAKTGATRSLQKAAGPPAPMLKVPIRTPGGARGFPCGGARELGGGGGTAGGRARGGGMVD